MGSGTDRKPETAPGPAPPSAPTVGPKGDDPAATCAGETAGSRPWTGRGEREGTMPATPREAPGPKGPGAARPPRFLGEYEVLDELARGGMGVVYRARQVKLNRLVALKVIRDSLLAGASDLRRFRSEAEAVAQLDHPNIVPIYEVGQVDDQPYFSMKLIEGGNLTRHVERLADDPRAAAILMEKVARAVHYAHRRAILHRDIKPSNILVDERGEPYVTDFGLAKRLEEGAGDASTQTRPGSVMGTPAYMPPEQALGKLRTLTTSADVYSLGATLYEALTGRPPFAAESVPEILRMAVDEAPTRPRAIRPSLDRDLETICLKCLEKDPARRYLSAEALAEDLRCWLAGLPIAGRPVSARERAQMWVRRRPTLAALIGLLNLALLALAVGGVAFTWKLQRSNATLLRMTDRAELSAYISEVNLTRRAIDAGDVADALDGLDRLALRSPGEADRRGFEWYYLRRLCDYERIATWKADAPVLCVAYSPDGRRIVTGHGFATKKGHDGRPGELIVWDAETGRRLLRVEAHAGPVFDVSVAPDGRTVATAGGDGVARAWEVASGKKVGEFGGFRASANGVAFSPDGRLLAATGGYRYMTSDGYGKSEVPGTVAVWEFAAGRRLWAEPDPTGAALGVAFTPDGTAVVSGSALAIQIREAATGRLRKSNPSWGARGIAFLDDGRMAVSTGAGFGAILATDASSLIFNKETLSDKGLGRGYGRVSDIACIPPDGVQIAVAYGYEFSNSPDIESLRARTRIVRVWDGRGRPLYRLTANRDKVRSIAYRPDGRRLVTTDESGAVHVWQTTLDKRSVDGRSYAALTRGYASPVRSVALTADGERLAAALEDGSIRIDDLSGAGAPLTLAGHALGANAVDFSPDGLALASAGKDGTVRLWDAATGAMRQLFAGLGGPVHGVAFSADGRTLASAGGDGSVRLWDTASLGPIRDWAAHPTMIHGLAYHPDGRSLATAGSDGTIRLWNSSNARPLGVLAKHSGDVLGVAFGGVGKVRIASVGRDGTVRLWDPENGQEILTLLGHKGEVPGLAFSADGRRLATFDSDRKAWIWEARENPYVLRGEADGR